MKVLRRTKLFCVLFCVAGLFTIAVYDAAGQDALAVADRLWRRTVRATADSDGPKLFSRSWEYRGTQEFGSQIKSSDVTIENRFEPAKDHDRTVGVRIASKPRAPWTEAAQCIQGTVVLKVTFLANGAIGPIAVVKGLPGGLTESAIKAAKMIVFVPARRNGIAYSVNKNVEYSFSIQ